MMYNNLPVLEVLWPKPMLKVHTIIFIYTIFLGDKILTQCSEEQYFSRVIYYISQILGLL